MSSLNDLIQDIPPKGGSGRLELLVVRAIVTQIMEFLRRELPAMKFEVSNKESIELSKDFIALHRSLDSLERSLSDYRDKKENSGVELIKIIGDLRDSIRSIKFPEAPKFPSEIGLTSATIQSLRVPPKVGIEEVSVSNFGGIIKCLDKIEEKLSGITFPDEMKVSNLKDLKFKFPDFKIPEGIEKALTKISSIVDQGPDSYIPVRLTNGKAFYDGIGKSVGSAVALGPIPGNSVRQNAVSGVLALTGTSATRITTSETLITRIDITVTSGPVAVGFDKSVLATSGSEYGVILYPAGGVHTIYINDLSKVYFAGDSERRVCYNYYL